MKKVVNFIMFRVLPKVIFIVGLIIALYPWISDYVYKDRMSNVVTEYEKTVDENKEKYTRLRQIGARYNKDLMLQVTTFSDPFDANRIRSELQKRYESYEDFPINIGDLVGTVSIPKIDVKLPIYFGTTDTILQGGVGLLRESSLPLEGKGVHSVLTGHTGLSNKKLFTDLNQLKEGDMFFVSCMGNKLAYKVFNIEVVLPDDLNSLYIQKDKNLCTLVTCTPYGVNSHRLLVIGKKVKYSEELENSQKKGDYSSDWKKEYFICVVIGLLVVVVIGFILRRKGRRNAKKKKGKKNS